MTLTRAPRAQSSRPARASAVTAATPADELTTPSPSPSPSSRGFRGTGLIATIAAPSNAALARKENNTGLPNGLKSGIENLSGYNLDEVKVHTNSAKAAQLNAHAFAQGTDIHIAPGAEQHLAHEAWHVVQQAEGRVVPK